MVHQSLAHPHSKASTQAVGGSLGQVACWGCPHVRMLVGAVVRWTVKAWLAEWRALDPARGGTSGDQPCNGVNPADGLNAIQLPPPLSRWMLQMQRFRLCHVPRFCVWTPSVSMDSPNQHPHVRTSPTCNLSKGSTDSLA